MDSSDFDCVKAEKAKAIRRYNRINTIGRIFRVMELCLALLFLFWTFTRLPFVVKVFGELFRRVAAVVSGPLFVFVLGNSIVIALVTRSDVFFSSSSSQRTETEFYEVFVRSGENRAKLPSSEHSEEEIVYDEKEAIITETFSNSNSNTLSREDSVKNAEADETESDSDPVLKIPKVYRRCKSEISEEWSPEKAGKGCLRRSDTEIIRKIRDSRDEIAINRMYPEDELTKEEFQKTIEAFIAKQLTFRRQESFSIVVQKPSLTRSG